MNKGGSDGGHDRGRGGRGHSDDGGADDRIDFSVPAADVDNIVIFLRDGDDEAEIDKKVDKDATIYGGAGRDELTGGSGDDQIFAGAGNDVVKAGGGNDLVVGGDGNDRLDGENGRDVLIGGAGRDRLRGGGGDDLLIGGFTSFDGNLFSLNLILAEWSSSRNYATRVENLREGTGPILSGTGTYLAASGTSRTVFDDGDKDMMKGGRGRDWFFAALDEQDEDLLRDLTSDEWLDLLSALS
ncbi:MAG: calcium-binding protein [Pirellulales bacterium]